MENRSLRHFSVLIKFISYDKESPLELFMKRFLILFDALFIRSFKFYKILKWQSTGDFYKLDGL